VSRAQRIAILAAAAVVLVGGFVLAQGSGDDDEASPPPGATQSAETATDVETAPNEPENPAATAPETTEQPPPRVETIRIRDQAPVGEPKTIEYSSGETIRLRFTSNKAVEVHIHGYDKYVNVRPGSSATTRFKANAEGIFELEEHATGNLLAKLEVRP
jgi:hypothetical protein